MGNTKAKKSSKRVKKPLAAEEPAVLSAAVYPVGEPSRNNTPRALTEAVQAEKASESTVPSTVMVTFVLVEPQAKQVSLCGDFNGWAPDATPMKRTDSVQWEATVELAPGSHQYKFVVDGQWMPDPRAQEHVWNRHGTLNSVIEVKR